MTGDGTLSDAHRVAEQAARTSYGRLIAMLAARTRDVAAAEDALADAFRTALETWPLRGIPGRPEAWLLTAARHRLDHGWRHEQVKVAAAPTLATIAEEAADMTGHTTFPDERLKLLFVSAHPAIDPAIQAPLMLQTVLGLEATHIASAFLVSPTAMGQRLVRAKSKIRDAGIAFEVPEGDALPERLAAVLAAIYAAYGTGWDDVLGGDPKRKGLTEEAIWLARALVALIPESPEPKGLLALMLYCEARRPARRTAAGAYVPLDRQNISLWSGPMIGEAERLLEEAAKIPQLGRFQLEAAIQSVHVERLVTGRANWEALLQLYWLLFTISPTAGIRVSYAVVVAEAGDAGRALSLLDEVQESLRDYQPYWAARGRVLQKLERNDEARRALETAAGLTEDEAVRAFLMSAEPTDRCSAKLKPGPTG
jgi:RNA polymerase sigma-70 factor (ECF subfamily)